MSSGEIGMTPIMREERLRKVSIYMDDAPRIATRGGRIALDRVGIEPIYLSGDGVHQVEVLTEEEKKMIAELAIPDAEEVGEQ